IAGLKTANQNGIASLNRKELRFRMLKRPFATVFMPPQLDIRWNQSDCACVVLDCECCAKQHCMRRSRFGHPTRDLSAARSLILISDVSVRCTGHFAAISISLDRKSVV